MVSPNISLGLLAFSWRLRSYTVYLKKIIPFLMEKMSFSIKKVPQMFVI